jgi:hypothetical protein
VKTYATTLAITLFLLTGCTGETFLSAGPGGEEEASEFDGATLSITSPLPAAIYFLNEPVPLEGSVLSADGEVLDFEDIVWTTDVEGEIATGTNAEAELEWGIKTFTVTADLPNGDRLQTVLGGVRVQGLHTGIYGGNFSISFNAEFEGTPITASCLGGLNFVVDMSGEVLIGDQGSCTVNLLVVGEFDVGYGVEADVAEDSADGNIQINTGFIDIPVGFEGNFEEESLSAEFEGNAFLFDFDGELQANRLSLYVDP